MDFDHRICVNEYGFYCVPAAYEKREIPKVLAAGEVYEPNTLRLMRRRLGDGDIVTGGAFIGDFFPALCSCLAPGARLISFEPNPLSFAAAEQTIALNGLTNAVLSPVAVGDAPGQLPLQLSRKGGSASAARAKIITDEEENPGDTVMVEVVTLDSLVAPGRDVSVLHLDVEGFEKQALLGATRLIRDSAPMIILEAERPWQRAMYRDFLGEHFPSVGYQLCGGLERNAIFLAQPR
ncbi:FkbM family methyltransferase [Primorskyibacter sp. 2E107]|uniref:FkbM family methyltransferase n=1 Tax=Primorskyibacter sp. 2E107 TaxID=3403458 RepID=UPI003AF9CF3E